MSITEIRDTIKQCKKLLYIGYLPPEIQCRIFYLCDSQHVERIEYLESEIVKINKMVSDFDYDLKNCAVCIQSFDDRTGVQGFFCRYCKYNKVQKRAVEHSLKKTLDEKKQCEDFKVNILSKRIITL